MVRLRSDNGVGTDILTRRSSPAVTPRRTRMKDSKRALWSLNKARRASSNMNGAQRAEANGQPKTPAAANQKIPQDVLSPPRQFMNEAAPNITMYMAKLEGKNAVLAWKLPGLITVISRKNMPILLLSVELVDMKRMVWHRAQPMAKPYLTK